jgi:hypothetical protein
VEVQYNAELNAAASQTSSTDSLPAPQDSSKPSTKDLPTVQLPNIDFPGTLADLFKLIGRDLQTALSSSDNNSKTSDGIDRNTLRSLSLRLLNLVDSKDTNTYARHRTPTRPRQRQRRRRGAGCDAPLQAAPAAADAAAAPAPATPRRPTAPRVIPAGPPGARYNSDTSATRPRVARHYFLSIASNVRTHFRLACPIAHPLGGERRTALRALALGSRHAAAQASSSPTTAPTPM